MENIKKEEKQSFGLGVVSSRKYTFIEASKILSIPYNTLYGYVQRGILPSYCGSKYPSYILGRDMLNEDFIRYVSFYKNRGRKHHGK